MMDRRGFLLQTLAAGMVAPRVFAQGGKEKADWPIVLFEKPVQNLRYAEICKKVAALGMRGLEATIRKGGHYEQVDAEKGLKEMMPAMRAAGLDTLIVATDVIRADQETEDFLKLMRDHGVTRYRLGFAKYDPKRDLLAQAREFNDQLKKLAELNAKLGMQGLFQLHSGWYIIGSLSWDAALILEGIDPDHLGLAFDPRHSRTDSGLSWKASFDVLQKHICALYVKDSRYEGVRNEKLVDVALDTGLVTKEVFDYAFGRIAPLPLSLHIEWGEHKIYPADVAHEAWPLIERDLEVLKGWIS